MKKQILIISMLGMLCATGTAGFKVPRYAHEELGEAQAEATEEGKPLAYIFTDPTST